MSIPLDSQTPNPSNSNTDPNLLAQLRKTLEDSNIFMVNQIEKNKKYINSLKQFLAWVYSCPQSVAPELTSLLLSNYQVQESFDYELSLIGELNRFICKSKYFTLNVELRSVDGLCVPVDEKIPVETKIYTSEAVPKQIENTMHGKEIIRGRPVECLVFNSIENKFLVRIKMQINEVTSHFVNGTINLVIRKSVSCPYKIRPLVVKDIVIKAKEKTCKRFREERS